MKTKRMLIFLMSLFLITPAVLGSTTTGEIKELSRTAPKATCEAGIVKKDVNTIAKKSSSKKIIRSSTDVLHG